MSKVNKRTVIIINESEGEVNIYTHNAGLKKRLAAFSEQNPDLCRLERKYPNDVESYLLDKSHLFICLLPPYSEKQREGIRERLQRSRVAAMPYRMIADHTQPRPEGRLSRLDETEQGRKRDYRKF